MPFKQIKSKTSFYTLEQTRAYLAKADFRPSYVVINTLGGVSNIASLLNLYKACGFDTEGSSLNHLDCELVGLGFWIEPLYKGYYISLGHTTGDNLPIDEVLEILKPVLENPSIKKILHNTKYDRKVLSTYGVDLQGSQDSMIMHYLLEPHKKHKLDTLSERYFGHYPTPYEVLLKKHGLNPKVDSIANVPIDVVASYCVFDCYNSYGLSVNFEKELKENNQWQLFTEIENPCEKIIAQMELNGVAIDLDKVEVVNKDLTSEITKLSEAYNEYVLQIIPGYEKPNIESSQEVSTVLFVHLNADTEISKLGKSGFYSVAENVLLALQEFHPIVDIILQYRKLKKLKSTYIDNIKENTHKITQRIYANFNQCVTVTGRLSSSSPINLQNIPSRGEKGALMRSLFVAPKDKKLVCIDFSQHELRILAHLSNDPILVEAYNTDANADLHLVVARIMFEKEDITTDERKAAKNINFGVIYGMAAHKLALMLGCSLDKAQDLLNKHKSALPYVDEFMTQLHSDAILKGYVETLFKRRRYFEFKDPYIEEVRKNYKTLNEMQVNYIKEKLQPYDAKLLREAGNAPIQGTSADITKKAMVDLQDSLITYNAKLIMQVHDELVFEVTECNAESFLTKAEYVMSNCVTLNVPIVAEGKIADNWYEAK